MVPESDGNDERKPPFKVVAPARPKSGGNRLIWLAIIVAIGMILAYAAGVLR
jgi:hypothetical protein